MRIDVCDSVMSWTLCSEQIYSAFLYFKDTRTVLVALDFLFTVRTNLNLYYR